MDATTSADPLELIPARDFLLGVSRRQLLRFGTDPATRLNGVIGRSSVVHAVTEAAWLGGVTVLVPACHVGVSGRRLDSLRPSDTPVSCGRAACRAASRTAHRAAPRSGSAAQHRIAAAGCVQQQLPLDLTA
ncbi:hypothetical protein [Kutzneria albida]|uniref:hypothetical protein n=1 Tax=Kutzneria albida TaxID=43357 RepID=UPI00046CF78E|nr:hypothetical protein [Kutzneria albida]